jgi:hypothetical protein
MFNFLNYLLLYYIKFLKVKLFYFVILKYKAALQSLPT